MHRSLTERIQDLRLLPRLVVESLPLKKAAVFQGLHAEIDSIQTQAHQLCDLAADQGDITESLQDLLDSLASQGDTPVSAAVLHAQLLPIYEAMREQTTQFTEVISVETETSVPALLAEGGL